MTDDQKELRSMCVNAERTLFDVCDYLAGIIGEGTSRTDSVTAEVFIMAADCLAKSGIDYWQNSSDYQQAKILICQ